MQFNSTNALIRLSGLQFRDQSLACPHCNWSGRAGQLKILTTAGLADSVRYSCPTCRKLIAQHAGLSSVEIAVGIDSVRQQLDAELAGSSLRAYGIYGEEDQAGGVLDFSEVRSCIQENTAGRHPSPRTLKPAQLPESTAQEAGEP
jgi:hypothetical protein